MGIIEIHDGISKRKQKTSAFTGTIRIHLSGEPQIQAPPSVTIDQSLDSRE